MNLDDFKAMVRFSRKSGYFQHDIRDPEKYEDTEGAIDIIREIDKAFLDSANDLGFDFHEAAGFGESKEATEMTDRIIDQVLAVDDNGLFLQMKPDPYISSLPEFKAWMNQWRDSVTSSELKSLESYWSLRAHG